MLGVGSRAGILTGMWMPLRRGRACLACRKLFPAPCKLGVVAASQHWNNTSWATQQAGGQPWIQETPSQKQNQQKLEQRLHTCGLTTNASWIRWCVLTEVGFHLPVLTWYCRETAGQALTHPIASKMWAFQESRNRDKLIPYWESRKSGEKENSLTLCWIVTCPTY